mmetsp:Transcript_1189/g.3471  ORF Transcript_1189/g.3471 Transcript_1189/m.3471 type:complete len:287 (+) Transcript_1189:148-1008(+)
MIGLGQRVWGAMHLWRLAKHLCEQLAVGSRSGPVPISPDCEHLHRRDGRGPSVDGLHLLSQKRWEQHHRAKEEQRPDWLREKLQQYCIQCHTSALAEAHKNDVFPVQAVLVEPGLDALDEGAAEQLHVVEHVQVLILESWAVPHVPRAIHDLWGLEVELAVGLAGRVLGPSHGQKGRGTEGRCDVLQHDTVALRVVADPDEQVGWRPGLAPVEARRQRALGAHCSHGLLREEEIQPFCLEFVPLLLLLPSLSFLIGRRQLALLLLALLLGGRLQLLSQRREDEHHL